ncbi:hypothetical protein I551_5934 [Mycobacterium ulcerans str. Harvey]|uniref:Uncharacterized protein n=1 Tax=Mycobacterium ulcerans str. Harvey TaxID=1299332 RepID=A0ABP3A9J0_MYCUL|nr:hypothetical protein I551_5934 [Mycobacterium ulcerans str. Harvey]
MAECHGARQFEPAHRAGYASAHRPQACLQLLLSSLMS